MTDTPRAGRLPGWRGRVAVVGMTGVMGVMGVMGVIPPTAAAGGSGAALAAPAAATAAAPAASAPAWPAIQVAATAGFHAGPFTRGARREQGRPDPGLDLPSPADAAAWRPVRLPLRQPPLGEPPGRSFRPRVAWYRVDYTVPADARDALALYASRVLGGAVLVVRHDGARWELVWDGLARGRPPWPRPVFVELGSAPPAGTRVHLALGLVIDPADGHQLSRVRVGPGPALAVQASHGRLLQQTLPLAGTLALLALAGLALVQGMWRRGGAGALLFFGSAAAAALHGLGEAVELPADEAAWLWSVWASRVAPTWSLLLAGLLALRLTAPRRPGAEWALMAGLALATLLSMPLPGLAWPALLPWPALQAVLALGLAGWLGRAAWVHAAGGLRAVVAGLALCGLMAGHDLLLAWGWLPAAAGPLDLHPLWPLVMLLLLLALLQAVAGRFAGGVGRLRRARAHLQRRVAAREALLRAQHERLRQQEGALALRRERERLLRDMHDGLGATLVSALALAEAGRLPPEALATLLRECVDDLRLVIDSLEPVEHDVVGVLASLRQRLGRRLASAGLVLDWQVQELPPLPWLEAPEALQVLRIVQEALTNALKHAAASRVCIRTRATDAGVRVEVEDDGRGFDPRCQGDGRGLRHQHLRAQGLGGRLQVLGRPGRGTRVVLELPLQRRPPC